MDITADGRDRLKTALLQILKILASRKLSQLDTNAERLQFFCTLPLSRAVAIVAVALQTIISGYTETDASLYFVSQNFGNIKFQFFFNFNFNSYFYSF